MCVWGYTRKYCRVSPLTSPNAPHLLRSNSTAGTDASFCLNSCISCNTYLFRKVLCSFFCMNNIAMHYIHNIIIYTHTVKHIHPQPSGVIQHFFSFFLRQDITFLLYTGCTDPLTFVKRHILPVWHALGTVCKEYPSQICTKLTASLVWP